jgi:acetate kinase
VSPSAPVGAALAAVKRGILTLNGGSATIKFALYEDSEPPRRRLHGLLDRVGSSGTTLSFARTDASDASSRIVLPESSSPIEFLIDWLERQLDLHALRAIGHRLVHGMHYAAPLLINDEVLTQLRRISALDPEHLPREIELIERCAERLRLPQVACFDTSFHRAMPRVAKLLSVPRRYQTADVQRYGFHGLSCAYLMEELVRVGDPAATAGRVILAHLGSGASMTAVRDGCSIDTSMGFTPASGLPMSTRSGDLDPGLVSYLMRASSLTVAQFERLANHESGMLGVSETSGDVRDLLEREHSDVRAAEAIELFCYQSRKWIGALAAALGGIDVLVFAGGVGEHAADIRGRICAELDYLGIRLDRNSNAHNAALISQQGARVRVRVMHTDEELMIARSVQRLLPQRD